MGRKSLKITEADIATMGWTVSQVQELEKLCEDAFEATRRLRGVAGWLLSDRGYLQEVVRLRDQYIQVPVVSRTSFPLGRTSSAPNGDPENASQFITALREFLDRWGLMFLSSWGLPTPQGPLLPDYLPAGAPARPTHGIYVYIPMHYRLKGDDGIQAKIEEYQKQAAVKLGIDPSFAGLAHFQTYEQMFRVVHLERSIRRRFENSRRGLVAAIEAAVAADCHLSIERVKRLRKLIAKCQRGGRARIKALHVKSS